MERLRWMSRKNTQRPIDVVKTSVWDVVGTTSLRRCEDVSFNTRRTDQFQTYWRRPWDVCLLGVVGLVRSPVGCLTLFLSKVFFLEWLLLFVACLWGIFPPISVIFLLYHPDMLGVCLVSYEGHCQKLSQNRDRYNPICLSMVKHIDRSKFPLFVVVEYNTICLL